MTDVKIIRAEDLGVKLNFTGRPKSGAIEPVGSGKDAAAGARTSGAGGGSPLEEVASALREQCRRSEWHVPPGQANDWRFMLAVVRAMTVAWYNPADTLPQRLQLAEALGRAFGMDDPALEQVVAEALAANSCVVAQLQLQHAALLANRFAVREDSFPPEKEAKAAYAAYRRKAMAETEELLQQQLTLPEFNGLLFGALLAGSGLKMHSGFSLFGGVGAKELHPYATAWLADRHGRRSDRRTTPVAPDCDSPTWDMVLEPLQVTSPDADLLLHVRSAIDRQRPSRSDATIGKTGVRLAGLLPGHTQHVSLPVYGSRGGGGGGFCFGCFGGGAQPAARQEDAGDGNMAATSMPQDEHESRILLDPTTGQMLGAQGRDVHGSLSVELRLVVEKRGRAGAGAADALALMQNAATKLNPAMARLRPQQQQGNDPSSNGGNAACIGGPGDPIWEAVEAAGKALRHVGVINAFFPADVKLKHKVDRHTLDAVTTSIDPSADYHGVFRRLAAALHTLSRERRLGGVPDPGIPLGALGGVGCLLDDRDGLEEAVVGALGCPGLGRPGLSLLLLFAKLFRIRHETQQVVLVALLLEAGWAPDNLAYMEALKLLWEPVMQWHCAARLTRLETDGLAGLMGSFLERACPALANHYDVFSGPDAVECMVLLLEMVGWALTWHPARAPPIHLLEDALGRATLARMSPALRPKQETLPGDIRVVTGEVDHAIEDLQRDMAVAEVLPGFGDMVTANARMRYDNITDHLETLLHYRPGRSGVSMSALWLLEERLVLLHDIMVKHKLAIQAEALAAAGSAPQPQTAASGGAAAAGSSSAKLPKQLAGGGAAAALMDSEAAAERDSDDVSMVSFDEGPEKGANGRGSDGGSSGAARAGSGGGAPPRCNRWCCTILRA